MSLIRPEFRSALLGRFSFAFRPRPYGVCYTFDSSDSCASGLPHQIRVSRLSCVSSLSIPLEPAIRFHRIR
jgi:hypothetical protein